LGIPLEGDGMVIEPDNNNNNNNNNNNSNIILNKTCCSGLYDDYNDFLELGV
jgi:hypothetical protein